MGLRDFGRVWGVDTDFPGAGEETNTTEILTRWVGMTVWRGGVSGDGIERPTVVGGKRVGKKQVPRGAQDDNFYRGGIGRWWPETGSNRRREGLSWPRAYH
jgi:hypothetical protein